MEIFVLSFTLGCGMQQKQAFQKMHLQERGFITCCPYFLIDVSMLFIYAKRYSIEKKFSCRRIIEFYCTAT
jgi:hypothetical protein